MYIDNGYGDSPPPPLPFCASGGLGYMDEFVAQSYGWSWQSFVSGCGVVEKATRKRMGRQLGSHIVPKSSKIVQNDTPESIPQVVQSVQLVSFSQLGQLTSHLP